MPCSCGSPNPYETCCGLFHSGEAMPATAEQLMRSRYSAFAKCEINYLKETTWPPYQKHFDEPGYRARAQDSIWLGLDVVECTGGQENDSKGTVLFVARTMMDATLNEHRENSLFKKKNGRWFYVRALV